MSLHIKPVCMSNLDTIVEMALATYQMEKDSCSTLPVSPDTDYIRERLSAIIETGTCRLATEAGNVVGFLAFEKAFSVGKGIYGATSPLFGYGIKHEKREAVIGKLFQNIAAELCERQTQSFSVNVYAHDTSVLWMYIMTSFAMNLTEAVKDTNTPIGLKTLDKFIYREVSKEELLNYKSDIIDLYRDLVNHLRVSPVFYHCRHFLPLEARFEDFLADNLRLFAAFKDNCLVGMINSEPVDIPLFKSDSQAVCMGDVFVKPQYRGQGVAAALLAFANDELKNDGIKRLLVTHGTINPNARGFWDKFFANYSYTMTRVIDADMLGKIERI